MIKKMHKLGSFFWGGAASKVLPDGTPVTSDLLDVSNFHIEFLVISTTGETNHDGTATAFTLLPQDSDGTVEVDYFKPATNNQLDVISAVTESAATNITYAVPSYTSTIPIERHRFAGLKIKADGGDADKTVTVQVDLFGWVA